MTSQGFCGPSPLVCSLDIVSVVIRFICFFVYLSQIQKKLNKTPSSLGLSPSKLFILKQALVLIPALLNFKVGIFIVLFKLFDAPLYSLVTFGLTGFLQLSLFGMQKKENDFLGYNSLVFRYLIYLFLVIQSLLQLAKNLSDSQTTLQTVYSQINFLMLIATYGVISLRYKNYDAVDMEAHLNDLLEHRLSQSSFTRTKKNKIVLSDEKFNSKKSLSDNSPKTNLHLKTKLLDSTPKLNRMETYTSPAFHAPSQIGSLVQRDSNSNSPISAISRFHGFQVSGTYDSFGVKVYYINYNNNLESKQQSRTYKEVMAFIMSISKKYENPVVTQLVELKRETGGNIEIQDEIMLQRVLSTIELNEDIQREFGYFLEVKNAQIWTQHFNALVKGRQLDSFAQRQFGFSHLDKSNPESTEILHEITELTNEGSQIGLKNNSAILSLIEFVEGQAYMVFIYCDQEGQQHLLRKSIVEFQKLISLLMKHTQLTSECYDLLSHFTNNLIQKLKAEFDDLITNMMQRPKYHPQVLNCFQKIFTE